MAIAAHVNWGAVVHEMVGVDLTTAGEAAHGIVLGAGWGDCGAIGRMENVIIRRASAATLGAHAIVIEDDGTNCYVDTVRVRNNTICTMAGGTPWITPLASGLSNATVTYADVPTVPFVNDTVGPFGVQTFPWGDPSYVNNDGTLDWNLQTQWGGPCP